MKSVSLQDLPAEGVSHNPDILKRVLIGPGEVDHLTNFSQATFRPGQVTTPHVHPTMHEIYLVERGTGRLVIDDKRVNLSPGVCVVVEAGESHSVDNTGSVDLVLTYFGIAV